jgi:hypothetical protein
MLLFWPTFLSSRAGSGHWLVSSKALKAAVLSFLLVVAYGGSYLRFCQSQSLARLTTRFCMAARLQRLHPRAARTSFFWAMFGRDIVNGYSNIAALLASNGRRD